jgi:hypothetical protein
VCGALVLLAAMVPAAEAAITLQARIIYAANQPGGVDPSLGAVAEELQRTFRYTMYRLVDAPRGSAELKQTWRVGLPGGRALEVVPTAIDRKQSTLAVRILGPDGQPLMNTTVRLRSGATVLLGGPRHDQGVLIIALSAG